MTYIVALTGGIASGKTTVSRLFEQKGVPIIDADIIARKVVEPESSALQSIIAKLGTTICHTDGSLNRKLLREKIVNDIELKHWLENLLHPLIQQQTRLQLQNVSTPFCLWVVPLLVENNLQTQADRVLVVDVSESLQIQRTIARDNVSLEQAIAMLKLQVSRDQRLAIADDIIQTDGPFSLVEQQVEQLYQYYIKLALEKGKCNGR